MCLMRKSHLGHNVNFFYFLNWPFFNDGIIKISRQIILHYWESNEPLLREKRKCARTAWAGSANQITRLDNKEIQNKNKRLQWLLGEGGPLNWGGYYGKQALTFVCTILPISWNHTCSHRRALVFTMPRWPSLAISTICSCNIAGHEVIRLNNTVSVHFNCSFTCS